MSIPAALTGEVAGRSFAERAVRVAGALAELGAQRLVFYEAGGQEQALEPRRTDLPGRLLGAAPGARLECTDLGLGFEISPESIRWRARDRATADVFRAAMATSSG